VFDVCACPRQNSSRLLDRVAILLPKIADDLLTGDIVGRFVVALISGDGLSQVADELSRRKVKLCHACQLADFRSYLQIGGVPSRNTLSTNCLAYTSFDTDANDQESGVWRLVFFNLSDFGHWFAAGKNVVPNPFGPVLLCFDPLVISQATDVSITLRSAGGRGFDRNDEGLDADDVPRLFIDADSRHVRFADSLREEFANPGARSPEMSCSFDNELASLSYLAYIVVDPYSFQTGLLADIVRRNLEGFRWSSRVFKRWCADGCEARYQVLLDAILSGVRNARELRGVIPNGSPMAAWRDAISRSADLTLQFGRYARYLFEGTVSQFT
jgi:hypothetical protein